ncbi:FMN-dependent NADH-azoreductase [Novosphingobium chloroacetimidivorans]|uniref:FMN-dependent NADH-azoreductase n=1 Tax=Novosphingobium chloroacetimidivorans TaxID=1428314 RepID=A0A7W7KA80_9SPHN|nr:NAD(P)H-dependent oxidoreductase [Novosphingobium chloroacetimidivorans]MBB4858796.1 FMN-dependent NADH-azoreductase [Novosphingobium chloroacetimidivorans]
MNQILAINSSISQRLLATIPDLLVNRSDLSDVPVPHLTPDTVAGIRAVATTKDELSAQGLSDDLSAELQEATILVIGAQMYNFSISTTLRSWLDHVLRPRVTFSFSELCPLGLLRGIRAIVIQARGGLYGEGPSKVLDFQEPYLKLLLGFVNADLLAFIKGENLA